MYTYGAEHEFLIKDVPRERMPVAQAMLNGLVGRTRSGHPVLHGHTVLCEELLFVAVELRGAALNDALAAAMLAWCCCNQRCRQNRWRCGLGRHGVNAARRGQRPSEQQGGLPAQ